VLAADYFDEEEDLGIRYKNVIGAGNRGSKGAVGQAGAPGSVTGTSASGTDPSLIYHPLSRKRKLIDPENMNEKPRVWRFEAPTPGQAEQWVRAINMGVRRATRLMSGASAIAQGASAPADLLWDAAVKSVVSTNNKATTPSTSGGSSTSSAAKRHTTSERVKKADLSSFLNSSVPSPPPALVRSQSQRLPTAHHRQTRGEERYSVHERDYLNTIDGLLDSLGDKAVHIGAESSRQTQLLSRLQDQVLGATDRTNGQTGSIGTYMRR